MCYYSPNSNMCYHSRISYFCNVSNCTKNTIKFWVGFSYVALQPLKPPSPLIL